MGPAMRSTFVLAGAALVHFLNVSYVAVVWQLSSRADPISSLF